MINNVEGGGMINFTHFSKNCCHRGRNSLIAKKALELIKVIHTNAHRNTTYIPQLVLFFGMTERGILDYIFGKLLT